MTVIEYTCLNGSFLISGFEENQGDKSLKLKFTRVKDGSVLLNGISHKIENGFAVIEKHSLQDGIFTPLVRIGTDSFVCDKIKSEAGSLIPEAQPQSRIFYLTKAIALMEEKNESIENRLFELSSYVYGKTIL